jgi:hypothetical protein
MDRLDRYRDTIERILSEYASIPYSHGDLQCEVVFDRARDRYLMLTVGWERGKRVHACIVHIDIIDGKIWIQTDGTEQGISLDLELAGIPKENIVLGFREPEVRPYTGYAIG